MTTTTIPGEQLAGAHVRATSVVAGAGRLLARHWPVLLALALGGRAARALVMWAAVRASDVHGLLGGLVFVLVPVTALAALVLMLRVVATSLPGLAAPAGADRRSLFDYTGSVLVPFLAIYASYG